MKQTCTNCLAPGLKSILKNIVILNCFKLVAFSSPNVSLSVKFCAKFEVVAAAVSEPEVKERRQLCNLEKVTL